MIRIPISPSSAESYAQCPRRYALEHYDTPSTFQEPLHTGNALHRTFKHWIDEKTKTGTWLELAEISSVFSSYLRDFDANKPRPNRTELEFLHGNWLEDGIYKLESFIRNLQSLIDSADVIDTERWVKLDLLLSNQAVRATGKVDLILQVGTEIWILDFKSGKVKAALLHSYPLALYTATARLEYPNMRVRAFEAYLEPYQLLEYNTEHLEPDLTALADITQTAFADNTFPMQPSGLCAWCEFYAICHPRLN